VKTNSLYISSVEPHAGSLIISMGMMEVLKARFQKVAFFRPFIQRKEKQDSDISFMLEHFGLDMTYELSYGFYVDEVEAFLSQNKEKELLSRLLEKFKYLQKEYDFIVCEGLNRESFNAAIGSDLNIEVSKNLGTPFISVLNAKDKSFQRVIDETKIQEETLKEHGLRHFASFINRVDAELGLRLKEKFSSQDAVFVLPEVEELDKPTVAEILEVFECEKVLGDEESLNRTVQRPKIAAMNLENYLPRMEEGDFILVPGDRAEIIVGALSAYHSKKHPHISGIMLTGGIMPSKEILTLFEGNEESSSVPVLRSDKNTFDAAVEVDGIHAKIRPFSDRKIALALGVFNANVDLGVIEKKFANYESKVTTPLMFEYSLFENARKEKKRIILPESLDERILRAVEILLRRDVVDIILLGNKEDILHKANAKDLDISKAEIIEPCRSELLEQFSQAFYEQRKNKGLSLIAARDAMMHSTYFATMMVQMGYADGMVSGAVHTTQDTIRPALQIIKTKEGMSLVSSLFFMCMDTRVLVYADCAVNQDPNAEDLAQIAIASADTAREFSIEPKIAMLSYSTGDSGQGIDVRKVKEATMIVKQRRPDLLIEGPIQYDAAIDPVVAASKLPHSQVAGQATVFIFPDLNTGNNTYKAVQRSSGAVAIGPVLQGLKKPVNDLSRGCLVADIVNTVAITAIQARASQ